MTKAVTTMVTCSECRGLKAREECVPIAKGMHGQPIRWACAPCFEVLKRKRIAAAKRRKAA